MGRFNTFVLVTLGWVVFRAASLAEAWRMLWIMLWPRAAEGGSTLLSGVIYTRGYLIVMALCALLVFQPVQGFDWTRRLTWAKALALIALFALSLATMFAQSFRSFLYFQF
jgi:alginate O-acetyltransferase complex protein AlgI